MAFVENHIICEPALQQEIVRRAVAGAFGDQPDRAANFLGTIALPDGRAAAVYLRHAADAILLDDFQQVVLITRSDNPGAGRLALPGGFIDEVDGRVETVLEAAMREAVEETGIAVSVLRGVAGIPVGRRRFARPFDIRMAYNDPPGTQIRKGEIFMVSTQGIRFRLAGNLLALDLRAGDDAKAVSVARIDTLKAGAFAVPDHLEMIREAAG